MIWTLLSLETCRRERGRWDFLEEPRLELTIAEGVQVSGRVGASQTGGGQDLGRFPGSCRDLGWPH